MPFLNFLFYKKFGSVEVLGIGSINSIGTKFFGFLLKKTGLISFLYILTIPKNIIFIIFFKKFFIFIILKMYIIINLNGTQHKVAEGAELKINKINIEKNNLFFINKILLISNKQNLFFYNKFCLKKIFIVCRVLRHFRSQKTKTIKFKKRKNINKIINFRNKFTLISIEKIFFNFLNIKSY